MRAEHAGSGRRPRRVRLSYREALWAESFQRLVEFKAEHGHCDVPARYAKSRSLARWVVDQRVYYHRGTLDLQRERRLTRLGLDWDPRETRWQAWLEELRAFRREHGHVAVPQGTGDCPELAAWVVRQRQLYGAGSLLEHRQGIRSSSRVGSDC